ncbi:MAG: serine hydrolase domain-containing protein [Bacteroidota bacterium]
MNAIGFLIRALIVTCICLFPAPVHVEEGNGIQQEMMSGDLSRLKIDDLFPQVVLPVGESFEKVHPSLDSLFRSYQKKRNFNGVVLFAEKGEVVHSAAYGSANFEQQIPLSIDTRFQLASVSKIYTSTAVLILMEKGLLGLDDPLKWHIPEFPYEGVSIRHLLTHRSGLARYMGLADAHWDRRKPLTNEEVLDLFIQHKPVLWSKPGKKFHYLNTNYAFLGLLIERVSGKSYPQFIQQEIIDPIGLHETKVVNYQDRLEEGKQAYATGYNRVRRKRKDAQGDYIDGVFGDKGVYASAKDLFRFEQALKNHLLLTPANQALAYQPGIRGKRVNNYGLGWRMKSYYPGMVYHFGWWRGFRSCLVRDLAAQKTMIILSNQDSPRHTVPYWSVFRFFHQQSSSDSRPWNQLEADYEAESLSAR